MMLDRDAWDTSCPDWEERIRDGRTLVPDLPELNEEEAARALRVFQRLRVPDVPGTPTNGAIAGPWLFPIVRAMFGAYDEARGRRLIQEFFLLVSKKNSKTSSSAAIMLTALIVNRRPQADLSLIAPTKRVADRSFNQAAGAIRLDPELIKLFHVQAHTRQITHRRSGAVLQVHAADTEVVTGSKSTFTLVDETHVFAARANAAAIFLELRGAFAARPDGFLMQITTQAKVPPAGVFRAELKRARDVRDGRVHYPMLPILYEFPRSVVKSGAWEDPRNWYMTNPNLGRSVREDFLRREMEMARREGPAAVALFASQHLNIELGMGLRTDRWPGAEFWEQGADADLTLDALLGRSEVVVVGVDGGGLDDLFGLAVLGRERETRTWLLWSHAWCHGGVLERRQSIASALRDFEAQGNLTIVSDELGDLSAIVALIRRVLDMGLLGAVAADPACLGELVDELAKIGVTQDNGLLIGVGQGYRLMNAIKTTERRLANRTLRHGGLALMAWCVSNLKIEPTATAIRATKQNAGDAKIDPAMAMFDAADVMILNPEPRGGRSIYETMSEDLAQEFGLQSAANGRQTDVRRQQSDAIVAERPAGWRQRDAEVSGGEIDVDILADPAHPRWNEMRELWEAKMAADRGDDED